MSAAGANAQSHRLEVVSHNLANVNTTGFKPHLSVVQSRHSGAIEQGLATGGEGTVDDIGGGVSIQPTLTQYKQGPIRQTGNKTDFALKDPGSFFSVQSGDDQLLTRAGNFLFDSQGTLVTQSGDPVLGEGGGLIRIDPRLPYEIAADGGVVQGGTRQELRVVRPRELGDLSRVGENMFQSLTPVQDVTPQQGGIISRAVEASAVDPTTAMMEMIEASRVYEANVRMIQHQDSAMGQLIGRVLKS